MPIRSLSELPTFFVPAVSSDLAERAGEAYPLEVYEITYLHYHAVLEMALCTEGSGVCVVEGVEYPFRAGDVQIIFPFQRHLSRSAPQGSRWLWVSLHPLRLLSLWNPGCVPRMEELLQTRMGLCGILDRAKRPLAAQLVERVVRPGEQALRLACLAALIEQLAEESSEMPPLALRPEQQFLRLEPALRLAEERLAAGELPSVEEMAARCAMPPASFRRAFHRAMGQSPRQYVQACQVRRAQHLLLNTNLGVTDIALSVGYQDASGFNRLFLHQCGLTPREYRKSYR